MTTKQTITQVVSAALTYYGEADLGRDTASSYWKIRRTTVSGDTTNVMYPIWEAKGPSDREEFIWDRRAEYNYSFTDDNTAPTLGTVTIASNNSDTTKAKVGDIITISITCSEALETASLIATINGHSATIADTGTNTYTATYTMVSGDTNGVITFTIDFTDIAGNVGTQVTTTTNGSSVTFDKTAPTATLLYSIDAGSNYYSTLSVKDADTLRIKATFSEALLDSPVVKLAIDNAVLAATNMTKTSTTVYYYDLNVPAGNVATATCSLSVGTDASGNVVTAAPTNATFNIDNDVPFMFGVVKDTVTQLTVEFDSAVTASTVTKANDGGFVVKDTATGLTTFAVSAVAPGVSSLYAVLTVADMTAAAAGGVTVTYVAAGNGTVADDAGNAMATDATGVDTGAF